MTNRKSFAKRCESCRWSFQCPNEQAHRICCRACELPEKTDETSR